MEENLKRFYDRPVSHISLFNEGNFRKHRKNEKDKSDLGVASTGLAIT